MKIFTASVVTLAVTVGFFAPMGTPAMAQHNQASGHMAQAETWNQRLDPTDGINTHQNDCQTLSCGCSPPAQDLPPTDEATSACPTDAVDCQCCEESFDADQKFHPEVRNVDLFGVAPEDCCDEWEGMSDFKAPKYKRSCGGLKADKGHLGIFWCQRKYGGDGCDYCNGGRCERKLGGNLSKLLPSFSLKDCLKKFCGLKSDDEASSAADEPVQETVFGRPVESDCNGRRRCDKGCSPQKGCSSCN